MNRRTAFLLSVVIGSAALLYLLSGMLLPFVAGLLVAYFLDPIADRLEKWGCSRTLATALITVAFFLLLGATMVLLFPLLQGQVMGLAAKAPALIAALREQAGPLLDLVQTSLDENQVAKIRDAAGSYAGEAARWLGGFLGRVLSGGVAVFQILSLLVITPLVSFYLLRDWDRLVARFDDLMPRDLQPTIRAQMWKSIDHRRLRADRPPCVRVGAWYERLTTIGLDPAWWSDFDRLISCRISAWAPAGVSWARLCSVFDGSVRLGRRVFGAGQVVDAYF